MLKERFDDFIFELLLRHLAGEVVEVLDYSQGDLAVGVLHKRKNDGKNALGHKFSTHIGTHRNDML